MEPSLIPMVKQFISQRDPFDRLDEEQLNQLINNVEISYLTQREVLKPQQIAGQGLYLVRTGAVEQRYADGSLRARLGSGDVFGFSVLNKTPESPGEYQVVAIENTLLYCISRDALLVAMEQNQAVCHHFACEEGQRLASRPKINSLAEDHLLYLNPVSSIENRNIVIISPGTSIQDAAQEMVQKHRSSALVMAGDVLLGIITDRDLTKRVVALGLDITKPVSKIMTENPVTISANAPIINAIELMMQHNIRSLPVMTNHRITGVLTATSLVQKNSMQAVYLISRIYRQDSLDELKALGIQRQSVFESLVESGVQSHTIQLMMTLIADAFNKQLLKLAERELGEPPCDYCWFAAGSQARQEMHYLSDQDNGIILARDITKEEEGWFRQLAEYVCYGLDECGYSLCPGHIMATNPKWCKPLSDWQAYYQQWLKEPEQLALLNISVFLDIRFLYGNQVLFNSLVLSAESHLKGSKRLLSMLVANSTRINPPLGMFRQFVLVKNGENHSAFNIKKQAINLLVELARVYSLEAGVFTPSTMTRFEVARDSGIISAASCQELTEAYLFINQVRFGCQRRALLAGDALTNLIVPQRLTQFERNHLKDAFRIIARTQEAAQQRYHAKGIMK
ncbi:MULTISPECIES: DUF294 nucleotidyltransferase-like domain-containing protein [Providencia]|uniref:Cyclic nucleotide-binding protein n=1 Tax=Providencia stuartii TaxID=588 RepID=A0A1S1HVY0_PROST|nr:DUF294 nucleotidyltransferase-like domain-containing protein [Providencia stuartii]ELR5041719.1 cyclic nucleotide-binding/CBS domain-containing protein [Providencia stuartii]ELR5083295.1 cyclic nucleotide-binding/CBS domain-containing protein [Providencia stuartii]OHT25581.1 cyclic nucleotide-binding protein [Providencia stuartii]